MGAEFYNDPTIFAGNVDPEHPSWEHGVMSLRRIAMLSGGYVALDSTGKVINPTGKILGK